MRESLGGGKGLADHPGQPLPDYIAERKYRKKRRKGDVNFSVSPFWFFCIFYDFAHPHLQKEYIIRKTHQREKNTKRKCEARIWRTTLRCSGAFYEGLFYWD